MKILVHLVRGWQVNRGGRWLKVYLPPSIVQCNKCGLTHTQTEMLSIPDWALAGEPEVGAMDIEIELKPCGFTSEVEQMLWRHEMKIGVYE